MTIEARYNLQKGIPEDKGTEATTYSNENILDAYIIERTKIKETFNIEKEVELKVE